MSGSLNVREYGSDPGNSLWGPFGGTAYRNVLSADVFRVSEAVWSMFAVPGGSRQLETRKSPKPTCDKLRVVVVRTGLIRKGRLMGQFLKSLH